MNGGVRRARCLLVWLVATGGCGATDALALPGLRLPEPVAFDALLVWLASLVLVGCSGWAWLVTTVVVVGVLRESTPRIPAPVAMRRLVLAACGAALSVGAASPALAETGSTARLEAVRGLVAALPFPDRAIAARSDHPPVPTVVVTPGDTLWSLAASRLPADASDAEVAAAWRRIYDRNRAVIGDDPDLLEPGQRLAVPPGEHHA